MSYILADVTTKLVFLQMTHYLLISLLNLPSTLQSFGQVSNLHVNEDKSMALNISLPNSLLDTLKDFKLTWSTKQIGYLSIQLTSDYSGLYSTNFIPTISSLNSQITSWFPHSLLMLGRITSIKMTILPKHLYLFRSLPIPMASK